MRPQQQNRRMRGRNNNGGGSGNNNSNNNNNNNRKGPNPLTRNYESNGPDVKIRGSAQQIAEKYTTLARDSQSSGDRVMAENYLQHAEHYNRIIAAAQAQMPIQQAQAMRDDNDDDQDDDRDDFSNSDANANANNAYGNNGNGNGQGRNNNDSQGRGNEGRGGNEGQGRGNEGRGGNEGQGRGNEGRGNNDTQARGNNDAPAQANPMQADPPSLNDGSGPQPVIEGMPAEVALNPQAVQHNARPRRERRPQVAPAALGASADAAELPASMMRAGPVVSEAPEAEEAAPPRRGRRPRRGERLPEQGSEADAPAVEASNETAPLATVED